MCRYIHFWRNIHLWSCLVHFSLYVLLSTIPHVLSPENYLAAAILSSMFLVTGYPSHRLARETKGNLSSTFLSLDSWSSHPAPQTLEVCLTLQLLWKFKIWENIYFLNIFWFVFNVIFWIIIIIKVSKNYWFGNGLDDHHDLNQLFDQSKCIFLSSSSKKWESVYVHHHNHPNSVNVCIVIILTCFFDRATKSFDRPP